MSLNPSTHIEISRSALASNLDFIRSTLSDGVKFSSVVKGNAYGHGIEIMIPLLENNGIDHFSVFNADEALRVFSHSGHNATIMIMGMITDEQLSWVIENEIEFFVFDAHRMILAEKLGQDIGKKALIHLELETGMNRTGLSSRELRKVLDIYHRSGSRFELKGMCTHFAGAESISNYYRIKSQNQRYKRAVQRLKKQNITPQRYHVACSAAALRYPTTQLDMARLGIVQYGFFPSNEVLIHYLTKKKEVENPLQRILSWKSTVMSTKTIKKGEFVGYGTSFFAGDTTQIATIPVGYSHGFTRALSNQGRVIINGNYAPVIGIVNMNMISVDVTNIDGVENGTEVIIIGKSGELEISVSSFNASNLINYELLTRLPGRIPRLIVE